MNTKRPDGISSLAGSIFGRYRQDLQRYLIHRLHGAQDARDLAQEVYLRLLRIADPSLVRQPQAYLYRIASNVVYEYRIREQSELVTFDSQALEELAETTAGTQEDELAHQLDTQRRLEQVLAKLPPLYRAILVMQKRDGLSYAEIARELGISIHTVEKYLFRALAHVRASKWEA